MITKETAQNFAEWFRATLDLQSTAQPCIYYFAGRVDFSPGSTTGGMAAPVYNGEAEIIIDKEWWDEQYDSPVEEKADLIFEKVQEFLEEAEDQEEESSSNLLGSSDVARILGWDVRKVSAYRGKGLIPAPVATIGGRPAWDPEDIQKHAREKGITTQVVEEMEIRYDYPTIEEAYRVGRAENGRYFFAWGPDLPYQDEIPVWNIPNGEGGTTWHDMEEEARAEMQDAIDANESIMD